jgi:hypothetical protein
MIKSTINYGNHTVLISLIGEKITKLTYTTVQTTTSNYNKTTTKEDLVLTIPIPAFVE